MVSTRLIRRLSAFVISRSQPDGAAANHIVPGLSFAGPSLGFHATRQRGSHIRFEHADGRKTAIPDHGIKDVPVGLMNKIIRHDLQMDIDGFFRKD